MAKPNDTRKRNLPQLGPIPRGLTSDLSGAGVLKHGELTEVIKTWKSEWAFANLFRVDGLISWMLENTSLKQIEVHSEIHGLLIRYSWGQPSALLLAQSLTSRSYFCHATAASLHGLLTYNPETIYINREQSPKPESTAPLRQEGIDRAFANRQRTSRDQYHSDRMRAVVLNGKNSGQLGVVDHLLGEIRVAATGIERTLIDMTVRPDYSGGPVQVLEAFKRARAHVSIDRLVAYLRRLNYRYPYHQAIGLLMQRAGYAEDHLDTLRGLGINFDFYVGYAVSDREFDPSWRVHFPRHL